MLDNVYRGNYADPQYPLLYFIGMGTSSSILSESNVFDVTGSPSIPTLKGRIFAASGGTRFHDVGSWFGDAPFTDIETYAAQKAPALSNVLGWTVPYPYTAGVSSTAVRQHVLDNAGAGKLDLHPPPP